MFICSLKLLSELHNYPVMRAQVALTRPKWTAPDHEERPPYPPTRCNLSPLVEERRNRGSWRTCVWQGKVQSNRTSTLTFFEPCSLHIPSSFPTN